MDKRGAIEKFSNYLKAYNIKTLKDLDLGTVRFTMEYLGFKNSPGKSIESCIWWYDEAAEVRVYFNETGVKFCKEYPQNYNELYRLLNFINSRIWVQGSDFSGRSLYKSSNLYNPSYLYDGRWVLRYNYDFYTAI